MHVCRYMCIICLFRCQVFSVTRHCIPERRFLTDPGTQPSSQQARELPHLHPPLRSTYKRTGFLCGFRGFELRSSCPRSKWTISPSTFNVLFCFGMFLSSRNRSVQTPLPPHSRSLLPVPPIQLPNLSDRGDLPGCLIQTKGGSHAFCSPSSLCSLVPPAAPYFGNIQCSGKLCFTKATLKPTIISTSLPLVLSLHLFTCAHACFMYVSMLFP